MADEPADYVIREPRLTCPLCYRNLDCIVTTENGRPQWSAAHPGQTNPTYPLPDRYANCPNMRRRWIFLIEEVPASSVGEGDPAGF